MAIKVNRKLTPLEEVEYRRRCALLTEQHMAAFRALLEELEVEMVDGQPYKVFTAKQNEDNYSLHV